ncbi:MAG: type II secretion system secretin GspD [Pseudomonadota bacterium]
MNIQGILRRLLALVVLMTALVAPLNAADGQWSINLRDADIRAFIDQVSAMTGKTFVVDQRIKGKITVIAPEPMSSATVYQVFLSVLNVNGFAAVPTGRVIKIVPDGNAKQDSIPLDTSARPAGDDMITRVIAISNSSAAELVPVLRPLVPQSGHLAAVPGANVLVVTDHAENVARLEQVITRIDGADNDELEVIQLTHAWVGDVLDMMNSFAASGEAGKASPRAGSSAISAGRVRVVADERTNRLILRGDPKARERLRDLVRTIDVPAEANTGSVQVLRLRHAEAKKTADILKGMVDGGGASTSSSAGKEGGAAALINPVGGKIAIQADESLNALVVRAEPSVMQQIKAVVAQLDVRRAQILIEAAIIEVGGSTGKDLGVQWASGDPDTGLIGTNFSGVGRSLNDFAAAIANPAAAASGLADGATIIGGKRDADGEIKFAGVLQALASNANVNLLSTPSVLTLDNQEASIIVGENVPFVTGSSTSTGNGVSNPFTTIKREDVGIQLKVTPTMIDEDNVKLVINQEVSSVKPTEDSIQSSDIITSKRAISTTVLAENRQTVVLGGLIEDRVTETVKKVPLLGDIPVLGILFRAKSVNRGKQNLMVFLRPSIVRDGKSAGSLSAAKYKGVRSLAIDINSRGDIARVQEDEALPEKMDDLFRGLGNGAVDGQEPAGAGQEGKAAPEAAVDTAPEKPAATPEAPAAAAPVPAQPAPAEPAAQTPAAASASADPVPAPAAVADTGAAPAEAAPAGGDDGRTEGSAAEDVPPGRAPGATDAAAEGSAVIPQSVQ